MRRRVAARFSFPEEKKHEMALTNQPRFAAAYWYSPVPPYVSNVSQGFFRLAKQEFLSYTLGRDGNVSEVSVMRKATPRCQLISDYLTRLSIQ